MLSPSASHAAAESVFATSTTLGVALPEPCVSIRDRYDAVMAGWRDRTNGQHGLAPAIVAAIEAGRDPADDPGVQRVLAAQGLDSRHQLDQEVTGLLADQTRAVLADHASDIVVGWRGSFERAVEAIVVAHAELQGTDLADYLGVVSRGPAAAAAWARAQEGLAAVSTVNTGWMALHNLLTGQQVNRHQLLTITKVDPADWLDRDLTGRPADPWAAAGEGLTFSLPTIAAFRSRVAAIEEERQRRVEIEQAARQAGERSSRGGIDTEFVRKVEQSRAAEAAA